MLCSGPGKWHQQDPCNALSRDFTLNWLLLTSTATGFAQPSPATLPSRVPKFEVVSIRPCTPDANSSGYIRATNGRLVIGCTTTEALIRSAYIFYPDGKPWPIDTKMGTLTLPIPYGLMQRPLKGSTGWIQSAYFSVNAKAEQPATGLTEAMMCGPMMQTVLKDRFQLRLHEESVEMPVYELTVANSAAKLRPWKEGDCTPQSPDGPPPARKPGQPIPPTLCGGLASAGPNKGLDAIGVTLAGFSQALSNYMDRDVVDKTGITGVFNIHLDLSFQDLHHKAFGSSSLPAIPDPAASDPVGTVEDALRKLGLRLKAGKMRVNVPVIDHVERPGGN